MGQANRNPVTVLKSGFEKFMVSGVKVIKGAGDNGVVEFHGLHPDVSIGISQIVF